MKTLGHAIRQAREARGVTLRAFAAQLGLSAAFVSRMERDQFAVPSEDNIRLIADLLHLNFFELMALAGKMPSELKEAFLRHPKQYAARVLSAPWFTRPLTVSEFLGQCFPDVSFSDFEQRRIAQLLPGATE